MSHMNVLRHIILMGLTLLLVWTDARAQHVQPNDSTRILTRATLYGAGLTRLQDTYLSPEEYTGWSVRMSRESVRATKLWDGRLIRQTLFRGYLAYTKNRADNNHSVHALANWNYGLHRRLPLSGNADVLLGAVGELNAGVTYNLRNGNNPASMLAYGSLDASAAVLWRPLVRQRPLSLRYQMLLPIVGLMFMPHYGQSYYEIFELGESGHTLRFTTPFNRPSVRHLLSADRALGRTTLRIAYEWDVQQARLNGIKTHVYSHALMIGVVRRLYRL